MPSKRSGDDAEREHYASQQSLAAVPNNILAGGTGSTRKRIASSGGGGASRTGQACDRCKVRKIRCDARLGGCTPCLQNNIECKTTDRITGRAVSRGHTETLESENHTLRSHLVELQQQLREHGIEPKQRPAYVPPTSPWAEQSQASWGDLHSGGMLTANSTMLGRKVSVLPAFRTGCIGDNYLGVSPGDDMLSPIVGTRLSLFGLVFDLAEFLPPETDPASDPTSYQTFLQLSVGKPVAQPKPPLPSLEECKMWAEHFFKTLQVFVPILHRPDFIKLITRVCQGQQEPTVPEIVMIHMVLAIMKFQASLRNNGEEPYRAQSMAHYHYAISFVPHLIIGHQIQDVQALALICLQLRQQPRLGAAWMFTNTVLGIALELGMHRSASAWQSTGPGQDPHTLEMRKRIFWSLLVLHVSISGKLGRPMPLRVQDFDIEIPEPLGDTISSDPPNMSKWRKCSFRAAIPGMKLLRILMQVYAAVYSVRADPAPYELNLGRLERELETFRDQLPPEINGGPQTVEDDRTPALYLQTGEEEIRLILHHPSLRTATSDVQAKNIDICLDASRKLLSAASELKKLNALDTTWYYSTDYLAAIFTTLFSWTERQDQMSSADFQQLEKDMEQWLGIMRDVGCLLGTGFRLHDRLSNIIASRLGHIRRHLASKTASAGLASSNTSDSPTGGQQPQHPPQHPPHPQESQQYPPPNGYTSAYTESAPSTDMSAHPPPGYAPAPQGVDRSQHAPTYPPPNHYYQELHQPPMSSYPGMGQFDTNSYHPDEVKPTLDAQHVAHPPMVQPPQYQPPPQHQPPQQQPLQQQLHHGPPQMTPPYSSPGYMAPYHPTGPAPNGYPPAPQGVNMAYQGQQAAWRDFSVDIINIPPHDYMHSANALMSLGADKQHMGMGGLQIAPHEDQQQHWPMVQYGHNPHGQGHAHQ